MVGAVGGAGGRYARWRALELLFVFTMLYQFLPATVFDADSYEPAGAMPWWAGFSSWLYPVLELFGVLVAVCLASWEGFFDNLGSFFSPRRAGLLVNLAFALAFFAAMSMSEYFARAGLWHFWGIAESRAASDVGASLASVPAWYGPVTLCLVGPFFEEMTARACLYRLFANRWLALAVSALVFAWMHTGFSVEILGYLPAGVCLGLAYQRRQRLLDSFLVHSAANFCAVMLPLALGADVVQLLNSFFHLLP